MKSVQLSAAEKQVMDIFWKNGRSLTSAELFEQAENAALSESYLYKVLNALEKKGYLSVCGVEPSGKSYLRRFLPCISKEEYVSSLLEMQGLEEESLARIAIALVKRTAGKQPSKEREKLLTELKDVLERFKSEGKD